MKNHSYCTNLLIVLLLLSSLNSIAQADIKWNKKNADKWFDKQEWLTGGKATEAAVKYDIHYVITGREKIGIGSLFKATLVVPYDSKRDIAFYDGKGKYYTAEPGTFFIAFLKQIHRPGLEVDGKGVEKKLVIKIRSSNK
jgi:YhcH/YjgK/YiaL family protein